MIIVTIVSGLVLWQHTVQDTEHRTTPAPNILTFRDRHLQVTHLNKQPTFSNISRTSAGMLYMALSGLCFVGVTVLVRYVGTRMPAPEAAFIRYVVGTLILAPVLFRIVRGSTKVTAWKTLLVRGVVHGLGVCLWFFAMARIPIAEVTALSYLTPVLMTIGAALFFGEKLYTRRILAIVFGLIGVFIILRPGFSSISIGQVAQLFTAPLFAASILITKKLTDTDELSVIVASLSIICSVTLLPLALLNWVNPNLIELGLLSLTAILATAGHFTLTKAITLAPISVIQPVTFLQLLWATLFGVWLFGESIDKYVVLGGTILVVSISYIAHRESVHKN